MSRTQSPLPRLTLALCAAAALALCPARGARAQDDARPAHAPSPKPARQFREAGPLNGQTSPDPEGFEFELNGFSYHVRRNGNGWRKKGERTRRFNLRLEAGGLARVYYADYGGRLLLVCEADDAENGGGFVTLLEQPSMRARWQQTYHAHNVGEPLREGRALYVTGVGFVGRINLETGQFDWQHDDLYDAGGGAADNFVAFETPELAGGAVLFRDKAVYNPRTTRVLDKKGGKILRVE
ncbi:MAG TPA: hypothetical protein VF508_03785 [Pyrinomonadaceae bacterium]